MVLDGLRGYLQLASGLTDVTRERALAAAKAVATQGAAGVNAVVPAPVTTQVSTLTEDLLAASKANRALLLHLIQAEIERSVARLGLVSAHELDAAARRAKGLEKRVAELEEELGRSSTARKAANTRAKKATAKKRTTKKRTTKKTTAKKSTADKSAEPTAARRSPGSTTETATTPTSDASMPTAEGSAPTTTTEGSGT